MNFNKKDIKKNLCRHLDSCISSQGWLFLVPFLAPPLFDFTGTLRSPCPRRQTLGSALPTTTSSRASQPWPPLKAAEIKSHRLLFFILYLIKKQHKTWLCLGWEQLQDTTVQCNSRDVVIIAVSVRIKRKPRAFFVVAKGLTPQVTGGGEKRWKFFSKI